MTKTTSRTTPLAVLFQGYRRRMNRRTLQKVVRQFSGPGREIGAGTTTSRGRFIGQGAPMSKFAPNEIVGALQKQLQEEYGPKPDMPLHILLLMEQLKEAEKNSPTATAPH
jgi:hypothetical protein